MSAGGPDLFVICKNCGSEVSPYITECPYCGNRLRKRAPKIDREGNVAEKPRRRRTTGSLPKFRPGEIPGIRVDTTRPVLTILIVVASLVMTILVQTPLVGVDTLGIFGKPGDEWWRVLTAPFLYVSVGHAFVALTAIAIFGWLLERRHGPWAVAALFLLGGAGGTLVATVVETTPVMCGATGAALAMLVAWAIPDVRERRAGVETDGDLIGAAVFGGVLLLLPIVVNPLADPVAGLVGVLSGLAVGIPLSRRG